MAGYIRQSTFVDGDTITAALFNNEYNQLVNAFSNTSGHKHDGTTAEGPVIGLIGDAGETSPNNKVLIDTTNNYIEFYVEVSSAPVQQLYIADGAIIPVTDSDIDLGTTSLRFKDTYTDTVTTTGNVSIGGDLTVTGSATISGNLTFGDADTDSINLAAEIDSDIIPNTDGTYDLGSATKEWQDLYIDGTANIDSLIADTADINGGTIDGATIATSDITVGSGKTLDVSSGTLTLADDQISGDKVEGGTIAATTVTTLTSTTGNITNVNATTLDTTNIEVTNLKAKDGTSAGSIADSTGVVTLASSVLTTTDINGGTIDGVTIGGTTAGAVTFTDLSDGTITIAGFADEDNMVSDSATLLPTQQSVKAYVDSQVTAQDLDFQGDTGGALSIDLDSESLTIAGGTGIDTSGATNTLTVAIDSTVATLTGTQTLTNKTFTSPDVNTPDIDGGTIDSTVIGGTTPAAGTFTTLTANTSITGTLATAAQPNITSVGTLTGLTTTGDINFGDDDKAVFGAGSDLQIYHDGTHSYIKDAGTGNLKIQGAAYVILESDEGEIMLRGQKNNSVKINYDGETKLETTSTGIDVTGTVVADGLTVDGNTTLQNTGDSFRALDFNANRSASDLTLARLDSQWNGTDVARIQVTSGSDATNKDNGYITLFTSETGTLKSRLQIQENGDISFYDDTGTSQALFWDASAESLGIGTTSPDTALHVNSGTTNTVATFESTDSTVIIPFIDSVGSTRIRSIDGAFSISTGGDAGSAGGTIEAMRIDSSQRVGIGTISPTRSLSISGTGSEYINIVGGTSSGVGLLLGDSDAEIRGALIYDNAGEVMSFRTNGNVERMRIDSSGNLLVGTTSTGAASGGSGTSGININANGGIELARSANPVLFVNRTTSDGDIVQFRKDGSTVGSIKSRGGAVSSIVLDPRASGAGLTATSDAILPADETGDPVDNNTDLGNSTLRFKDLYLSGGAYLGGTGSANHLDDYEEGTWTPSLAGSTTSGSHTYLYRNGQYTKVGNKVTASFGIAITTKDATMAGNVLVSGLPISASMATNVFAGLAVGWSANITYGDMLGGYMNSGTSIALRLNDSAAASGFLNSSAIGASSVYLFGTITYQTA